MAQLPTVGRVVHLYGKDVLFWQRPDLRMKTPDPQPTFTGPFSATVVFVHNDGTANLRVDYPSPALGSAHTSEILERVACGDDLTVPRPSDTRPWWVWPPRA